MKAEMIRGYFEKTLSAADCKDLLAQLYASDDCPDKRIDRSHELDQLLNITASLSVNNLRVGLALA